MHRSTKSDYLPPSRLEWFETQITLITLRTHALLLLSLVINRALCAHNRSCPLWRSTVRTMVAAPCPPNFSTPVNYFHPFNTHLFSCCFNHTFRSIFVPAFTSLFIRASYWLRPVLPASLCCPSIRRGIQYWMLDICFVDLITSAISRLRQVKQVPDRGPSTHGIYSSMPATAPSSLYLTMRT